MDKSCCELKLEMSSSWSAYKRILNAYGVDESLLPFIVGIVVIFLTAGMFL